MLGGRGGTADREKLERSVAVTPRWRPCLLLRFMPRRWRGRQHHQRWRRWRYAVARGKTARRAAAAPLSIYKHLYQAKHEGGARPPRTTLRFLRLPLPCLPVATRVFVPRLKRACKTRLPLAARVTFLLAHACLCTLLAWALVSRAFFAVATRGSSLEPPSPSPFLHACCFTAGLPLCSHPATPSAAARLEEE